MHEVTARKVEWLEDELDERYMDISDIKVKEFYKERDRQVLVKMLRMNDKVGDSVFDEMIDALKAKRKYESTLRKFRGIEDRWSRTGYIDFGKPNNLKILKTVSSRGVV